MTGTGFFRVPAAFASYTALGTEMSRNRQSSDISLVITGPEPVGRVMPPLMIVSMTS
jgi:hypothetical protein